MCLLLVSQHQRIGGESGLNQLREYLYLSVQDGGIGPELGRVEYHIRLYSLVFHAPVQGRQLQPPIRVLLRETGDLLGCALLQRIMLVTVDGEGGLVVLEQKAGAAEWLVQAAAIVPELREVAPHGQVVHRQNHVGMGVAAESRGGALLGGQAPADFVSSFEYADAHAAVFRQVHRQQQALVASPNDHGIEREISHRTSFTKPSFDLHGQWMLAEPWSYRNSLLRSPGAASGLRDAEY